jgi:hypothetical protein
VQLRNLQDMTIGQRVVLTFLIVLVVLIALALFGYLTGGWDVQAEPRLPLDLYEGIPLDAQLLPIDRKALEQAYHNHVVKLFTVWLTDGAKDATHFRNGLRISRGAYQLADQALIKREQALKQQEQAK